MPFSYVSTIQKEMVPNQNVNVHATLSMRTKDPNKIETKSSQALPPVKGDCVLQNSKYGFDLLFILFGTFTFPYTYYFLSFQRNQI